MLKKISLLCCFIFAFQVGFSQSDHIEPEHIKTIIFKPASTNTYAPIIKLGESLRLSFDDLNADEHYYTYKIEHCTFDWQPSNLIASEFVKGYAEDRIRTYENSFNTLQPYTNYNLTIPNDNTRLIISGNYIISILDEDDEIVFSKTVCGV